MNYKLKKLVEHEFNKRENKYNYNKTGALRGFWRGTNSTTLYLIILHHG